MAFCLQYYTYNNEKNKNTSYTIKYLTLQKEASAYLSYAALSAIKFVPGGRRRMRFVESKWRDAIQFGRMTWEKNWLGTQTLNNVLLISSISLSFWDFIPKHCLLSSLTQVSCTFCLSVIDWKISRGLWQWGSAINVEHEVCPSLFHFLPSWFIIR